jgi:hypothetical protein
MVSLVKMTTRLFDYTAEKEVIALYLSLILHVKRPELTIYAPASDCFRTILLFSLQSFENNRSTQLSDELTTCIVATECAQIFEENLLKLFVLSELGDKNNLINEWHPRACSVG